MRRLHLKFYLAIVGTLMLFLLCGVMIWHHLSPPQAAIAGIESATGLAAWMVDRAATVEREREVIDSLAGQLHADVALYDAAGASVHTSGKAYPLTREQIAEGGWHITQSGPTYNYWLANDRHLIVHPRSGFVLYGLHTGLLLTTAAIILAMLTYPISRGITARLGRLQAGVLQFGGGDLAARVKVEGGDEVASLARSFNESAGRIEQLIRAHQMLLANCSHELRTPLARVRLGIDRVPGTDPKVSAELARSIAELDALIGEMLLSSRLQVSSGLDRAEPVDLLALTAEEAAHFDRDVGGTPLTITADPLLLRRLVRNLLDNARLHGGGATDVRIESDQHRARIIVEDAGAGVPDADRERIFEPFYRSLTGADAATGSSGTGLGLAIVRQIAHAHGGSVEYAAREHGGSRFIVTLPRGAGVAASGSASERR
ncbi:MAG TPA: ATP-binding protein [Steroidobacteraceae bacterium]|jgi:signal transduction histidine kinase|nr:ATP-binding protein [Steroidobacteraceae bacterium]